MTCGDQIIHDIEHELDRVANKAPYPICLGQHNDKWVVTIEVNSTRGTFDIETSDPKRNLALIKALTALRGHLNTAA